MTIASLIVNVGANTVEFMRDLGRVNGELDVIEKGMSRFGAGMKTVGLGLTAAITAPILAIGAAAIKLGMNAVESENLVAVSFGSMAGAARKWSTTLSDSLGLNEFELRKTAGTLFNMTTSMGLSKDAAFEMSTGVAELAADMASFRNIGMDEALTKIRSGLVGEAEPLKAIGILVDENTVKQYAYKTGIAATGAELTQQQKVLARWQAILAQTSNDQGDLARTLESPTNQLRIMRARIEEAATTLGMALMPVVSRVIGAFTSLVPYIEQAVQWFTKLPPQVQVGAVVLAALAAAAGPALVALGFMATNIAALLPLMASLGVTTTGTAAAMAIFGKSVAIVGAAFVGWNVGKLVGEVTGLTDWVGRKLASAFYGVSAAEYQATRSAVAWADAQDPVAGLIANVTSETKGLTAAMLKEIDAQKNFLNPKAVKEAEQAAAKLREELTKLQGTTTQLTGSIAVWENQLIEAIPPAELMAVRLNAINAATIGVSASMSQKLIPGSIAVSGRLADIENAGIATAKSLATIGEGATQSVPAVDRLKASLLSMAEVAIAAGSALVGVLSTKAGFGSVATTAVSIGTGLAGAAIAASAWGTSMAASGVAGSIALGAATLGIGLAVVGVIALVKAMNNGADEARAFRRELYDAAGGMEVLRAAAVRAGYDFDRLVNTNNIKAAEAAWKDLEAALEFQASAMQTLVDTAQRYNLTIEQLGPAFAAQQLDQQAQQLFQDWEVLNAAGVATVDITTAMAGKVNEYFQAAQRTGTEVPRALQPILQKMIELGLLTDANGLAFESLEATGVTFSETFREGADRIIDAVRELTDAITRGLSPAIKNVPSLVIPVELDAKVPGWARDSWNQWKAEQGAIMHDGGPVGRLLPFIPRAHSGLAIGEVPIIAQRGEVMFSRANVAAMGGVGATEAFRRGLGGGGRGSVVNISTARLEAQIEALRKQQTKADEQQAARDRNMPALFSLAARDAVQQQARRR